MNILSLAVTGQFLPRDFMPHGYCFLWDPLVLWLHVVSDGLIALSYYCIPIVLIYFIRKNREIPFNRIFWMFGTFILACGTTHIMEIWNVWHGSYLLAGAIKAITAAVSVITAAMLIPLVPMVISLPGRAQLREANRRLEEQIEEYKRVGQWPEEAPLRRWTTIAFIVAVLITCLMGFLSWRSTRVAASDSDWVNHTYAVMEKLEVTAKHVIEAETSARGFFLTGQEMLLQHYQGAQSTIVEDEDTLRRLTGDNAGQQGRLDTLETQISAVAKFAQTIVTMRHDTRVVPGRALIEEGEALTSTVLETIHQMQAEERRLLDERTQKAAAARHFTSLVTVAGVFVAAGFLVLAGFAIRREIGLSMRARAQLSTLNAELEQRVEQRTAALQSEIAERERIAEARERLAAVVESSDDAIISKTLDGVITSWNRAAEKMFGYPAAEAVGRPMLMLIPPERANEESDILARIRRGESVKHLETVRVRKDGKSIDVSETISPIKDGSGAIVGASKIARDITERRRAEEALHESQERFQAMANGIPQLAWMAEADGHIFWYNQRWYEYTGTTFEQMQGWGWQSTHDPEILPKVLEGWKAAIAAGKPFDMEFPLRGADGRFRTFLTRVMPVKNSDDRVVRWFGTNTDISERKKAEEKLAGQAEELARSRQALEEQTRMLKLVLDSMGEGLVAADREGHFLLWNDAAKKLMGRGAADLPPDQWSPHYKVYLPDGITPHPAESLPLVRALRGESVQQELVVQNPESKESVFLEVTARPLKDDQGNLCGGVAAMRDITQRRAAERKIQEFNQELEARVVERTAQLEAANKDLEAFTYSVSHDLRAPLRHISGFTKILAEEFGPSLPAEGQKQLQRIEQGAKHMGRLVDELLNLARVGRQELTVQIAGLGSLVKEVMTILEPESEGRQVEWKIGELPFVECDPTLVRQVFQNLIHNALKYSRPRSPAVIEIGHCEKEGQTVIFVRDNGVGFSMKYADKLFGVFQRLHRAEDFEGTGVGLATVHRIITKHGGRVWAEAEVDRGASFYFTLGSGEHSAAKAAAATTGG